MPRPLIEFVQSQNIPWSLSSSREGAEVKMLSADDTTCASTELLRLPPEWTSTPEEWCDVDEELFVLSGSFSVNGRNYERHHYAYWPAGFIRGSFKAGTSGAVLILCRSGAPTYAGTAANAPQFSLEDLTEQLDPFRLRWDQTNMDPNISHLNAYRKNLRLAPDGTCRTYLLAGLPQGFPESGTEALERHPHVEEMFMIAGDMPCSLGVMRAGAYFWRPPGIWHGADCTVNGFLLFARTPGSNQTISEWSDEPHAVRFDPEHDPQLPNELIHAGAPIDDPTRY
jgi:hypothetical protein